MKFRKKPVVVDAFVLGIDHMPDWFCDKRSKNEIVTFGYCDHLSGCHIHTLEGVMTASRGDYIIKGVQGEVYPCKPDIFAMTYEPTDGKGE